MYKETLPLPKQDKLTQDSKSYNRIKGVRICKKLLFVVFKECSLQGYVKNFLNSMSVESKLVYYYFLNSILCFFTVMKLPTCKYRNDTCNLGETFCLVLSSACKVQLSNILKIMIG